MGKPRPGPTSRGAVVGRGSLGDSVASVIQVLIVDDDARVREGLRTLLALDPGLRISGEASTFDEALRAAEDLRPDVVLLDLELAADRGFALLCALRRQGLPVIGLAVYPGGDAEALEAGAFRYLLKDAPRQQLVAAIYAAHQTRSGAAPDGLST